MKLLKDMGQILRNGALSMLLSLCEPEINSRVVLCRVWLLSGTSLSDSLADDIKRLRYILFLRERCGSENFRCPQSLEAARVGFWEEFTSCVSSKDLANRSSDSSAARRISEQYFCTGLRFDSHSPASNIVITFDSK